MKGIVFSEFIEMVEDKFSPEVADAIIERASLPSSGAYTSVATYDHSELVTLVNELSKEVNIPVQDLVKAYGKHLLTRFYELYPTFFEGVHSTFGFLDTIENHVHVEVRKLYPDAELPTFESKISSHTMLLSYRSRRPLGARAEGLIEGCAEHYGEKIAINKEDLSKDGEYHINYRLTLVDE